MRISLWGPSSSRRPVSSGGDPIVKAPAGTTIISGQAPQSRNRVPAARSDAGADFPSCVTALPGVTGQISNSKMLSEDFMSVPPEGGSRPSPQHAAACRSRFFRQTNRYLRMIGIVAIGGDGLCTARDEYAWAVHLTFVSVAECLLEVE